ncbi:hypothetical protein RhiirB3_456834 [Rhizophagus irregularis]|nr:hypothetical protein RhiirB3_456834 [Rhizophagus irregularis]
MYFSTFSGSSYTKGANPYTLVERSGHTANVSKPFNLDSTLPISDLSNDSRYVNAYGNGVSTICDPNKDTIFLILFNGHQPSVIKMEHIYIYGSGSGVNNGKDMMDIINTTKTHWYLESSDSNIVPKNLASAILLPDGRIAYIGET